MTDESQLLTTKQLAQYVNKPVHTIRAWRQRKVGPAGFRVGRDVMYRKSVVDDWLRRMESADATRQVEGHSEVQERKRVGASA